MARGAIGLIEQSTVFDVGRCVSMPLRPDGGGYQKRDKRQE
jgi:hypothetical protein